MINKKIEDILESDLQDLIDNKVLEWKTLDYKRELPNNSDSAKKEFLADVTSCANSSGGDLIFGIAQDNKTGEPKTLDGIDVENIDNEKTRLDNIIRDGVKPRMLSVVIKPIRLSNEKNVIIIRIPKSWNSPHRVTFGGHAKFYARNSSGKYEMDVDELRVAFNLSETITNRIRDFRVDRIAKIAADESPVTLDSNPKIVLHLIPVNAFNPSQKYDINHIYSNRHDKLPLIRLRTTNGRYNLEGLYTYSEYGKDKFSSYTQLYRNGIIEAVDASIIEKETKNITMNLFEMQLMKSLSSYMKLLKELTIALPAYVFLSMLGVKNYKIFKDILEIHPIDRDMLLLPETIIDDYGTDVKDVLRPSFDLVWNACGLPHSLNFDENNNWIIK